jgi:hypothetical protein
LAAYIVRQRFGKPPKAETHGKSVAEMVDFPRTETPEELAKINAKTSEPADSELFDTGWISQAA